MIETCPSGPTTAAVVPLPANAAIAAGSLAAVSLVQSLLADERGLPVPDWSDHVNA